MLNPSVLFRRNRDEQYSLAITRKQNRLSILSAVTGQLCIPSSRARNWISSLRAPGFPLLSRPVTVTRYVCHVVSPNTSAHTLSSVKSRDAYSVTPRPFTFPYVTSYPWALPFHGRCQQMEALDDVTSMAWTLRGAANRTPH